MHDYLKHVEHNFRNYIAHLNLDESQNVSPDPGWTKHAFDTDKINGMLISIIRQLVYDEWTFMKENGIDDISEKIDIHDKQILQDLKAKGVKVLQTPDVEIIRSGFLQTARFSTPYEATEDKSKGPAEPNLYLTYTVESISEETGIIIRVQLERLDSLGRLVESFYDRRVQIKLPPVNVPEDYSFKLVDENFETYRCTSNSSCWSTLSETI